jgi:hypothetical protein
MYDKVDKFIAETTVFLVKINSNIAHYKKQYYVVMLNRKMIKRHQFTHSAYSHTTVYLSPFTHSFIYFF